MEAPQQWRREAGGKRASPMPTETSPTFLGPTPLPAHSPTKDGPCGPTTAPAALCSLSHLCLQVEDLFLTFAKGFSLQQLV